MGKKAVGELTRLKRALARMTKDRDSWKEANIENAKGLTDMIAGKNEKVTSLEGDLAEAQAQKADVERVTRWVCEELRNEIDRMDAKLRGAHTTKDKIHIRATLAELRLERMEKKGA